MDPTTLVTFLYRAPAEARTVELLGSWDRFEQPYRMHHDRRRGIWSGIFKFENICFDGDGLRRTKPRSGGLRQGATYWYYYRMNSYDDTFDDRQPSTTSCPLIPGQAVNIIEVPIELVELPTRCCSASHMEGIEGSLSNWQSLSTLDPASKYAVLDPPTSKIHARSLSDGTLKGRLENQPMSIAEAIASAPPTPYYECTNSPGFEQIESRNGLSRDSSMYSRGTSCSAAVSDLAAHTHERAGEGINGFSYTSAAEPALFQIPEVVEASTSSTSGTPEHDPFPGVQPGHGLIDGSVAELHQKLVDVETSIATRKVSVWSLGPISIQNVQFYNESRPGTMLNEDPEQHRPRVYSLPNSEVRRSEEGSLEVSPMSTALRLPAAVANQEDTPTPDSDLIEFNLESPSFSAASASSDGGESPLLLSPQNSIKIETRPASRSGGGPLTGFANRIRSIRTRHHPPSLRREAEQPLSRLSPPSFVNYALPYAVESNHSLAKTMSQPSIHTRSAHAHLPAPTVFNDELPLPSLFAAEEEGSMADAIFSELGYLGASIG